MNPLDGLWLLQLLRGTGHPPPVAQADETQLGSWLHGLVHLAEPAGVNSRFGTRRRVGRSWV